MHIFPLALVSTLTHYAPRILIKPNQTAYLVAPRLPLCRVALLVLLTSIMQLPPSLAPHPPPSQIPSNTLVKYLDIFILLVILAFSLFNVPRTLVYIANNRSEAFQGYLLRSATRFRMYSPPSEATEQPKEKPEGPSEFSVTSLESAAMPKQWHFPMHISLRHPAAGLIHHRVLGNYTILQVLLMAGYSAAVLFAALYKSNPFSNPVRIGWVIASQFPFVYAFATKNNVIGLLVGVGYEKVCVEKSIETCSILS